MRMGRGWKLVVWAFCAALAMPSAKAENARRFKVTFYCSCERCTGKYSPSRGGLGLTALGNQPLPFRTVAVGDASLLGRWIYFEDLGGWVLASDTGTKCTSRLGRVERPLGKSSLPIVKKNGSPGCVDINQVDVFVGGREMHDRAVLLGVQEWWGRVE